MSTVFDQTCAALGLPDTNAREREVIATRIIELGRNG
jgi:hypothetical protein